MSELLHIKNVDVRREFATKDYFITIRLTNKFIEDMNYGGHKWLGEMPVDYIAESLYNHIRDGYYSLKKLETFIYENFQEHLDTIKADKEVDMALSLLKYLKRLEEFLGRNETLLKE